MACASGRANDWYCFCRQCYFCICAVYSAFLHGVSREHYWIFGNINARLYYCYRFIIPYYCIWVNHLYSVHF